MLELFRVESETQTAILTASLLQLEHQPTAAHELEALMRAAHSLKGAARLVDLDPAVWIAHAMEDCFVAAQRGEVRLAREEIDTLFKGVDLLQNIGRRSEDDLTSWADAHRSEIERFLDALARLLGKGAASLEPSLAASPATSLARQHATETAPTGTPVPHEAVPAVVDNSAPAVRKAASPERVLRLTADNLNRLLGLAGESLVESRWLRPFAQNMQRLKRLHAEVSETFDRMRARFRELELPEQTTVQIQDLAGRLNECNLFLTERLNELEVFDRRSAQLSHRLYLEVLRTRMRPFSEGARQFPRLVRDLARTLGKEVHFEIAGEQTQVDRDILEKLESPLAHLLRNAVDHGCELPAARRQAGKPVPAVVRLEARHCAGMLVVTVADDGAGVDLRLLRTALVRRRLATPALVEKMDEAELLEFLFLPGFTLKEGVTEISGRGVGLDVVHNMVKSVRGTVRVSTQAGHGTRFQLQLPLTLSVLRALLVEIGAEPYAIPLSHIHRTLRLPREQVELLEGRPHFRLQAESIGLLAAHQVFGCGPPDVAADSLQVVVMGDRSARYGLIVDRFLGERELVVQPLDPRLGKVKDISAAAFMEDGTPVLIVDVDDLLRSLEKLVAEGNVLRLDPPVARGPALRRKRVLAVDDSRTVRELQRKLLAGRGYDADVAVDGMDGWNAVRTGGYDLVITDVDMPRLDGIELTRLIKQDPQLEHLPVLIVSYKDREEDRLRGLEAGADYYLTKSSFHDETLLQAVADLIGEAES
jgi:two-component system sensor histidine kinase and response regulator WspE